MDSTNDSDSTNDIKEHQVTIKSLYQKGSDFYKRHKINKDYEEITTLQNIDKFFCKNFKEYTQNTKRDLNNTEIYIIIFKSIENIKILINQLDIFLNNQENKDILVLAIEDYKSFYKLLRLLQITYFNSTSCSSKIKNFNYINKTTYKEEFLKFVLTIITDELLYCSILTKLHNPYLISKKNPDIKDTEMLIASHFNDVVCFKNTADEDSFIDKYFSTENKLPKYDNLDFINYRYELSNNKDIQDASLNNLIILENNLKNTYFVNVVTMYNVDESIKNFKFIEEYKYFEYSEKESNHEHFNHGDILLYTCVINRNNIDTEIIKFSKIDYDSKYETLDNGMTFDDLFTDNDETKCNKEKTKLKNHQDVSKIVFVVLRKILWTLDSDINNSDISNSVIYSDNFLLGKDTDTKFKKIKYIDTNDDNIFIGDFYNSDSKQVLRIPKSNIPINNNYAPSFNNEKRKISNNEYKNYNGSEITNSKQAKANKKIDVSELLTRDFDENVISSKDKVKYLEYLKYPSNDKIMYEVYKNYHFYNEIKLNKYNDNTDKYQKIINKYKGKSSNTQYDYITYDTSYNAYKKNIIVLLSREGIENLINNKDEPEKKSVMYKLQYNFSNSIANKFNKYSNKSKRQGRLSRAGEAASHINDVFSSLSSGGGTKKTIMNNKKNKSIKNQFKEKKQYNKKTSRKFFDRS